MLASLRELVPRDVSILRRLSSSCIPVNRGSHHGPNPQTQLAQVAAEQVAGVERGPPPARALPQQLPPEQRARVVAPEPGRDSGTSSSPCPVPHLFLSRLPQSGLTPHTLYIAHYDLTPSRTCSYSHRNTLGGQPPLP